MSQVAAQQESAVSDVPVGTVRAIVVPDDKQFPVRVVESPGELTRLTEMGVFPKGIVTCANGEVGAVHYDQLPEGSQANRRATRAATMLLPGFSNRNMFFGTVMLFGLTEEWRLTGLDPKWDLQLFPFVPIVGGESRCR